jgi:hypothetical protein
MWACSQLYPETQLPVEIASPGNLINAVIRLVFEAVVIGLTLFQTLGAFRLQQGLKMFEAKSLSSFILRNGGCFSFD